MTPQFTHWRKSSRSGNQSACVEVGSGRGLIGVRDTKDRDGGTLALSRAAWVRFVGAVKSDRFGS
ncbi:DUF397 domain-containing protein [Saccharopolyspora sp. 5N708]|uniref:DUF397 domain-containing protein n=1 Tax=Saccharopolyspora sp. 5N708 TaxID=3457424 RepID=UPI003FCFBAC5